MYVMCVLWLVIFSLLVFSSTVNSASIRLNCIETPISFHLNTIEYTFSNKFDQRRSSAQT